MAVVTRVPVRQGHAVRQGSVVVEVSGRPVILLRGDLPAYRDLHVGDKGPDVAQLIRALRVLGYVDGDAEDTYSSGTATALKQLYGHLKYEPPTVDSTGPTNSGSSATEGEVAGAAETGPNDAAASEKTAPQVYLPAAEVVFVPSSSAVAISVPVRRGSIVKGPVLTLAWGGLQVRATLPDEDKGLVSVGQRVELSSGQDGMRRVAIVSAIGRYSAGASRDSTSGDATQGLPGSSGTVTPNDSDASDGEAGYPLVIKGRKPIPAVWNGADLQVSITTAATSAPVLAVPIAAVYSSADSSTRVVKWVGGRKIPVEVRTGVSANGWVQVTPIGSIALLKGDQVVVGQ
ncbi:hypothetical protein [Planotetraspora thailandica]|nr:hypothetical protein [Planotetraspora thailandica]